MKRVQHAKFSSLVCQPLRKGRRKKKVISLSCPRVNADDDTCFFFIFLIFNAVFYYIQSWIDLIKLTICFVILTVKSFRTKTL